MKWQSAGLRLRPPRFGWVRDWASISWRISEESLARLPRRRAPTKCHRRVIFAEIRSLEKKRKERNPDRNRIWFFFTFISFSFQFSWWRMTWNSRDRYGSSCLRTIRVESQTLFSRCEKARKKNDGEEFYWRSSFFGIIERTNRKDFVENSILSMQKKRKKKENTTCFALSKILRSHYRNEMARAFAKFPSVSQKKKALHNLFFFFLPSTNTFAFTGFLR